MQPDYIVLRDYVRQTVPMEPVDPCEALTVVPPWPDLSPCMACGQPVEGDEKGFSVLGWQHPQVQMVRVLGPSHNGECWEQARSLVEQNRPHELVAFEHYQRLNAGQHGEPYDPQVVRYWPPLEQM